MFENRRALSRCQYPVYNQAHGDEVDCGEPAVVRWEFNNGDIMYVCDEHNYADTEDDKVVHILPSCQVIHVDGPTETPCGDPAVAARDFGEEGELFVCEEHDSMVEETMYGEEDDDA